MRRTSSIGAEEGKSILRTMMPYGLLRVLAQLDQLLLQLGRPARCR